MVECSSFVGYEGKKIKETRISDHELLFLQL
jgi:hypothetical protein